MVDSGNRYTQDGETDRDRGVRRDVHADSGAGKGGDHWDGARNAAYSDGAPRTTHFTSPDGKEVYNFYNSNVTIIQDKDGHCTFKNHRTEQDRACDAHHHRRHHHHRHEQQRHPYAPRPEHPNYYDYNGRTPQDYRHRSGAPAYDGSQGQYSYGVPRQPEYRAPYTTDRNYNRTPDQDEFQRERARQMEMQRQNEQRYSGRVEDPRYNGTYNPRYDGAYTPNYGGDPQYSRPVDRYGYGSVDQYGRPVGQYGSVDQYGRPVDQYGSVDQYGRPVDQNGYPLDQRPTVVYQQQPEYHSTTIGGGRGGMIYSDQSYGGPQDSQEQARQTIATIGSIVVAARNGGRGYGGYGGYDGGYYGRGGYDGGYYGRGGYGGYYGRGGYDPNCYGGYDSRYGRGMPGTDYVYGAGGVPIGAPNRGGYYGGVYGAGGVPIYSSGGGGYYGRGGYDGGYRQTTVGGGPGGIVYSDSGYGQSTPADQAMRWLALGGSIYAATRRGR